MVAVRRPALLLLVLFVAFCCTRNAPAASDSKPTADDSLPKLLWREPDRVTPQDWICGPGGCGRTPTPPFQFVKEDSGGTNPKMSVKDAKGLSWSIKFGAEVIPECFGSRFLTALGYFAEPTYFVASGKVEGAKSLKATRRVVEKDGSFTRARFELRGEKDFVFLEHRQWGWNDNPFQGSHELAGLKILMLLMSNWDDKDDRDGDDSNNNVFRGIVQGGPTLLYAVSDWGASLGRWGGIRRRDQSDCAGYTRDDPKFIKAGRGGAIEWGYDGKHNDIKNGITVEDIRWLLPHLRRITDEDLRTGLKASGATERQARCWSSAIENRVRQLEAVAR
jgi:hypothetical protein